MNARALQFAVGILTWVSWAAFLVVVRLMPDRCANPAAWDATLPGVTVIFALYTVGSLVLSIWAVLSALTAET